MKRKYVWGFRGVQGVVASVDYDSKTLEPGEIVIKGTGPTVELIKQSLGVALDMDGHILGTHTDPQNLEAFLQQSLGYLKPYRASPYPIPNLDRDLPPGFIY